jgi:2'-5' RNA ligase
MWQLQQEIEQRMGSAGFPRETNPFKPHLTLGRMRSLRKADALTGMVKREPIEQRGFVINSVSLMKSNLSPAGAVYQSLLTIGLKQ